MKKDLKFNYLEIALVGYLIIVLLLLVQLKINQVLLVLIPGALLAGFIILNNKMVTIICYMIFLLVSFTTVTFDSYNNAIRLIVLIVILIVPSIILYDRILRFDIESISISSSSMNTQIKMKVAGIIIIILAIIASVIFILTILPPFNTYLGANNTTELQSLLLMAISIMVCIPFLEV